MKKIYFVFFAVISLVAGCKKDTFTDHNPRPERSVSMKTSSKTVFAKALARAIASDQSLRAFIKEESLKQFDNDNDVLFQMVMEQKLVNGETIYSTVSKYAESKEIFDSSLQMIPTISIMVPELPNFSPTSWNTETEIPQVAVDPENKRSSVLVYNANHEVVEVPYGNVPAFPVVVVKENERVNVTVNGQDKSPKSARLLADDKDVSSKKPFFSKNGVTFSFSNDAFDGINETTNVSSKQGGDNQISRVVSKFPSPYYIPLDQRVVDAYTLGSEWHRDYIYYNILPPTTDRGPLNRTYIEHIVGIQMEPTEPIGRISDNSGDPAPTQAGYTRGSIKPAEWTDGYFDFRISVLINGKNGAGTTLSKVFSASGSDMYSVKYTLNSNGLSYSYSHVEARMHLVNIPLVTWDLENYGSAWKFSVSEYDASESVTITNTNTTVHAANFEFSQQFGDKVKVGAKFGASSTTTNTSTYTLVRTTGSDDLGEAVLDFSHPVILNEFSTTDPRNGSVSNYYNTYEISTGSVRLAIEPKPIN